MFRERQQQHEHLARLAADGAGRYHDGDLRDEGSRKVTGASKSRII
jgi:hypothetical protein